MLFRCHYKNVRISNIQITHDYTTCSNWHKEESEHCSFITFHLPYLIAILVSVFIFLSIRNTLLYVTWHFSSFGLLGPNEIYKVDGLPMAHALHTLSLIEGTWRYSNVIKINVVRIFTTLCHRKEEHLFFTHL